RPNMPDGAGRVQSLGTNCDTVHDSPATEDTEWICKVGQTLGGGRVAAVGEEAIGLQQTGRSDELVGIPPERGTIGAAAGAKDALVQTIQLRPVFGRLQSLDGRCGGIVLQPGLYLLELLVEDAHVHYQVADDRQTGQRSQHQLVTAGGRGYRCDACQAVGTTDAHAVGATHSFPA